jgi:hypothetical protein
VRDVLDRPGRQVVEHQHLVAEVEEPLGEVRADEAGAAGEKRLQSAATSDAVVGT